MAVRFLQAATLAATLLACAASEEEPARPRPTVILIVLDNVRADRLSLCGYRHPTSLTLQAMCDRDAVCTCEGEAPSTWTLPSHASFFTGAELAEHGASMVASGTDATIEVRWGRGVRPLGPDLPTLAEQMAERGYQTVLLSGNPLIAPAVGLTRGFEVTLSAKRFDQIHGGALVRRLERLLGDPRDPERPLFLFLNIADAHQPWKAVREDLGWLPRRPRLSFEIDLESGNETRQRFTRGQMEEHEAEALLSHLSDVYDYGVFRADRTLRQSLKTLRQAGYFKGDFRLIITSDHGEHLGERSLLGHAGPFVYETLTQVPIVVRSSRPIGELPARPSAIEVYDLALHGKLREGGRPVRAADYASESWSRWFGPRFGDHPGAAIWLGNEKLVWHGGEYLLYDLAADPQEMSPMPLGEHPGRAELETLARAVELSAVEGFSPSSETEELLRALGYLD